MSKILFCLITIFTLLFTGGCKKNTTPDFDNLEEELDYIMGRYTKMGAAIGIIDYQQQGKEFFYGSTSNQNDLPPDQYSVFEIGSITKTFTSTLLGQMTFDKSINLTDTVQSLLPQDQVTLPAGSDSAIIISHLATHSSGLPRVPRDSDQPLPSGYDPYDPYAAYETSHVYDYLTNWCSLLSEPGTQYSYSNTGAGLLGHILGLQDDSSFEELLSRAVFESLGMHQSSLFISTDQLSHLAPGHNENLDSVKNYHATDIFQGAGFIKSSLHDMMIFLRAQIGLIDSPLAGGIALTQQSHFNVGDVTYSDREGRYNLSIGLGWHIHTESDTYSYCYHGGRTNGYMAFMAFHRNKPAGFVVLFNHSVPNVINMIGEEIWTAIRSY